MSIAETIKDLAPVVTAIGVVIAAWQLWLAKNQAQSKFEDGFAEQYRGIVQRIPLDALLGRQLTDAQLKESLRVFYEYFDLSNEQAFIAKKRRLRSATWKNWREGIEQHLNRPAFQQAWLALEPNLAGSFEEFRALFPNLLNPEKSLARLAKEAWAVSQGEGVEVTETDSPPTPLYGVDSSEWVFFCVGRRGGPIRGFIAVHKARGEARVLEDIQSNAWAVRE